MSPTNTERPIRILLVNPNSSKSMTSSMEAVARSVASDDVEIHTYTASSSAPASINDDKDIQASDEVVLDDFLKSDDLRSGKYDAMLVACFSVNPLVEVLGRWCPTVTGIFEAGIVSAEAVASLGSTESWGIVTTGKFWEKHLADGVDEFHRKHGGSENVGFAGVFSTGLNAGDFHVVDPEEVRAKLAEATTKLLGQGNVTRVVMGCGGMVGLEDIIRSTAATVYGKDRADKMLIIDGVKAGIVQLEHIARNKRTST